MGSSEDHIRLLKEFLVAIEDLVEGTLVPAGRRGTRVAARMVQSWIHWLHTEHIPRLTRPARDYLGLDAKLAAWSRWARDQFADGVVVQEHVPIDEGYVFLPAKEHVRKGGHLERRGGPPPDPMVEHVVVSPRPAPDQRRGRSSVIPTRVTTEVTTQVAQITATPTPIGKRERKLRFSEVEVVDSERRRPTRNWDRMIRNAVLQKSLRVPAARTKPTSERTETTGGGRSSTATLSSATPLPEPRHGHEDHPESTES